MTLKKALVIVNGHARNGAMQAEKIKSLLAEHKLDCTFVRLKKGEDAGVMVQRHAKGHFCVIIGGGDGTLNAAAKGIMATKLPLGILPLGTANDLARTLGLPTDIGAAIQVIAKGRTRLIDLGEVNGKPFFNVASIGFSAELAQRLTKKAKKRWGVLGYALTALRILWSNKPFGVTLVHGRKRERVRTIQVAVGNGHYYGGGMSVAADAKPDDGKLDVYSLEISHWIELLAMLPLLKTGTHVAWPTVRGLQTDAVELRTRRKMPVNADGEIVTHTPAIFKVNKAAITVFVV